MLNSKLAEQLPHLLRSFIVVPARLVTLHPASHTLSLPPDSHTSSLAIPLEPDQVSAALRVPVNVLQDYQNQRGEPDARLDLNTPLAIPCPS